MELPSLPLRLELLKLLLATSKASRSSDESSNMLPINEVFTTDDSKLMRDRWQSNSLTVSHYPAKSQCGEMPKMGSEVGSCGVLLTISIPPPALAGLGTTSQASRPWQDGQIQGHVARASASANSRQPCSQSCAHEFSISYPRT